MITTVVEHPLKEERPSLNPSVQTPTVRILIVDDHELFRDGIRALINNQPGFEVCGEAADERTAVQLIRHLEPDLVVLDISLAAGNGLAVAKWIRQNRPLIKIVVSSMHDERVYGERVLRLGVHGYVNKQAPARQILTAIRNVLDGGLFYGEQLTHSVLRRVMADPLNAADSPIDLLSDRELEVSACLARGCRQAKLLPSSKSARAPSPRIETG
jgi:DNA-binding NarL/FixJ family response regulator